MMLQRGSAKFVVDRDWGALLPEVEWEIYRQVLDDIHQRRLPYAIGGGLAMSLYTRRWRNTKDMDLFVKPEDRQAFIDVLTELSFEDYYARDPYDRSWIYRGYRQGMIVDVIWEMANHRATVDDGWLTRGPRVTMRNRTVRAVPPEELIWAKLYVMDRTRCDWPEVLNLLYAQAGDLAWDHLLRRVGEDRLLLAALLATFRWLSPQGAQHVPAWVWEQLGLGGLPTDSPDAGEQRRAALLNGFNDWFGPPDEGRSMTL